MTSKTEKVTKGFGRHTPDFMKFYYCAEKKQIIVTLKRKKSKND